jgi:N-acetylmuramate 1-kinase
MSGSATEQSDNERLAAVNDWVQARCGPGMVITTASSDASFRRYFRVQCDDETYIVMDAPPAQEDCRPFVEIAARLAACGVNVPQILDSDLTQGFLLLSDLGRRSYLDELNADNADVLYADAVKALLQIQTQADAAGLPVYDADRLRQELQLFTDWYLGRHLGLELHASELSDLEAIFDALISRATAQPQVFVHRDYMPRNLMVTRPNPGILDFQDAVLGPISYDVISLFKDAFISWPEPRVAGWIESYWQAARGCDLSLPDLTEFRIDIDWMGLQRHLKVLGIFARIHYRDGKPHYLVDAPRFVNYVMIVVARYPQLTPLLDLIRTRVLPAQAPA